MRGFVAQNFFCPTPIPKSFLRPWDGISFYIKKHIANGYTIVKSFGRAIVFAKLDKCFFSLEEDMYFCVAYIPPESSTLHTYDNFDFYSIIESDINNYAQKGKVYLCGDLNSRTAQKCDYINYCNIEKYVESAPGDIFTENLLPRISQDKITNSFGNRLIHMCKETGLRILNGRHDMDQCVGKYTCFNHNGASVVDYLLTNFKNFKDVNYFCVGDLTQYSKHVPVIFKITADVRCKKNTDVFKKKNG